jgi:hypothetical protein
MLLSWIRINGSLGTVDDGFHECLMIISKDELYPIITTIIFIANPNFQ